MADFTRLTAEVEETKTVTQSAIQLLENLSTRLREEANNPAAINALADELDANGAALAAAVVANTPSEGEPTPPTA